MIKFRSCILAKMPQNSEVVPFWGPSYQKILEAAMSHMVLSARVSTAVIAFPFAMNSHPERSYLETAQMSGQVTAGLEEL